MSGGVILSDVGLDPFLGEGPVGGGGRGEELIGKCDDDGDAGIGEGGEDGRVGVEKLHLFNPLCFQKLHHLGWLWEIIGNAAIVHCD